MAKFIKDTKEFSRLQDAKKKFKIKCNNCDHMLHFYPFENKDRKICRYCGVYIYKDEETKKKYEKEDFERKLKKYMRDSIENNKTNKKI